MLRRQASRLADQLMQVEQAQRVATDKMHDVQGQLLSQLHRKEAAAAELEEQARRVAQEKMIEVEEDIIRRGKALEADRAEADEQARRISHPYVHDASAEDVKCHVQEELLSNAHRVAAAALEHRELERRVEGQRREKALGQLLSFVGRRTAAKAEEEERERRVSEEHMRDVQSELISAVGRKTAAQAEEEERQRRLRSAPVVWPSKARSKQLRDLHASIVRYFSAQQALQEADYERVLSIAMANKRAMEGEFLARIAEKSP
jgi:hypothetical protein